jgi:hypothetical protein
MSEFCKSPMDMVAKPTSGYKGSTASKYDGEEGLQQRTSSPNAVPEVSRDGMKPAMPGGGFVVTPMESIPKK